MELIKLLFITQLEKAREVTDAANIRAAYAEVMTAALTGETSNGVTADNGTGDAKKYSATVIATQTQANWQNTDIQTSLTKLLTDQTTPVAAKTKDATWTVSCTVGGVVTIQ